MSDAAAISRNGVLGRICWPLGSVVLPDATKGPVEQILVGMEFVLQQASSKGALDLAFTSCSLLPSGKSHLAHDLIHVLHNPFDDHGCVDISRALKELGQRSPTLISNYLISKYPIP